MASLHSITENIRTVGKWGGIGAIAIILLYCMVLFGRTVKEYLYPTPPLPPTVRFGKLPAIPFPSPTTLPNKTYEIDTQTGDLPELSDRASVYKLAQTPTDILAVQKRQEEVKRIGFVAPGIALSPTTYQWTDQILPSRRLVMDIQTKNFVLTSDYKTNPDVLVASNLPTEFEAKKIAQEFLSRLDSFPIDIDTNKTTTKLLSVNKDETFSQATSLSTAQLVRVDFFQKDITDFALYYPHPPQSTMYVFVSGGDREAQIVEAHYTHYGSTEESATYPIKTAHMAYEKLTSGNAHIASYFGSNNTIAIRTITLGYYIGEERQSYLLPIIIFEGDDGFFAYVSALQDDWIQP